MSTQGRPGNSEGRRRNKRARLVCTRCHEKKIKCDLQTFTGQQEQRCTGCVDAFAECQVRPSQRGTARRRAVVTGDSLQVGSRDRPSPQAEGHLVISPQSPQQQEGPDTITIGSVGNGLNTRAPLSRSIQFQPGHSRGSIPFSQTPEQRSGDLGDVLGRAQSIVTPGQQSQSSQGNSHRAAYLADSGYMSIFRDEPAEDEETPEETPASDRAHIPIAPVLQESYLDTYFEYCYTWCPILDRTTMQLFPEFFDSALLREALALVGSHLSPPLMPHPKPREHYLRTRQLFYENHERQPLVRICAVMLLYWWSVGPPNVVSIDTNWWWMGASIRLAQEIGLHREQDPAQLMRPGETPGLRRRIWWTLFARERLTAIMHGRPCAIDPDYSDVRLPSVDDFPDPTDPRAEIFVRWVHLCEIIGRVGKAIAQGKIHDFRSSPAKDLISWAQNLPDHLQLPISGDRTTSFNREVNQLHLPYLATIILLHLRRSTHKLPRASATAIVAASCVARVFEDFLGRGTLRFLPGQAGWYIAISILALLHARQIETLTAHADAQISILRTALKQMAVMWHSSKMFYVGFEKILPITSTDGSGMQNLPSATMAAASPLPGGQAQTSHILGQNEQPSHLSPTMDDITATDDISWTDYFPYVTMNTSPLIAALMANAFTIPFSNMEFSQYSYLFDFLDDLNAEIF